MAELADAYGSGPYGETRGGSSPLVSSSPTNLGETRASVRTEERAIRSAVRRLGIHPTKQGVAAQRPAREVAGFKTAVRYEFRSARAERCADEQGQRDYASFENFHSPIVRRAEEGVKF